MHVPYTVLVFPPRAPALTGFIPNVLLLACAHRVSSSPPGYLSSLIRISLLFTSVHIFRFSPFISRVGWGWVKGVLKSGSFLLQVSFQTHIQVISLGAGTFICWPSPLPLVLCCVAMLCAGFPCVHAHLRFFPHGEMGDRGVQGGGEVLLKQTWVISRLSYCCLPPPCSEL